MKTLLIVEDEKMIRQGLHVMIKRSGVPVDVILECKNGEEALEVLSYQQVDVMSGHAPVRGRTDEDTANG